jgi:hypothetical protein
MPLVAGVRWSFRGKDAGNARSRRLRARLRTQSSGRAARPGGTVGISPRPPSNTGSLEAGQLLVGGAARGRADVGALELDPGVRVLVRRGLREADDELGGVALLPQ